MKGPIAQSQFNLNLLNSPSLASFVTLIISLKKKTKALSHLISKIKKK